MARDGSQAGAATVHRAFNELACRSDVALARWDAPRGRARRSPRCRRPTPSARDEVTQAAGAYARTDVVRAVETSAGAGVGEDPTRQQLAVPAPRHRADRRGHAARAGEE